MSAPDDGHVRIVRLSGTCRTGFQGDGGRVLHYVRGEDSWGAALCGARPGRRSAYGWLTAGTAGDGTWCRKCIERNHRAVARARGGAT